MTRLLVVMASAACLVAACATHTETYVLVPDDQGKTSPVTVTAREGQSLVLDKPYAAAVGGAKSLEAVSLDKAAIDKQFGDVLATQPPAPKSFLLYFSEGDELTAESKLELEKVFAEIAARPAADIMVVGHTDRVGKLEDNDALSKRRAERVRLELIGRGLPADSIQAAGRGEREPLVPTADEVKEARNRRVEINVR
jgi:outer membrane protein OmpA-like peptidoglycan-associated protein